VANVLISVLIDTYNHEQFIEQAIASVLEQDFAQSDVEIVVVDDGSTDRTPEIIRRFEPHVRLIRKTNGGQASAFNLGIPQCKGEIIAFLDGDDWWARGKLRSVAEQMRNDKSIGMIGHAIVQSYSDGREVVIALEQGERLRLNSKETAEILRLHRCYLGTSRLTLRSSIARQVLPIPETLIFEADEYLFTVAGILADFMILTEPLSYYRIHGANLFVAPGSGPDGIRRKQRVLAALAASLRNDLARYGLGTEASECVLELVEAEARQLRLMLDGGKPWETFRTEGTMYRIQHADASWTQKIFRQTTMILALVLPPRWFYAARRWIGGQAWYQHARKEVLQVPGITKTSLPQNLNDEGRP
jgi:hypothetical protein